MKTLVAAALSLCLAVPVHAQSRPDPQVVADNGHPTAQLLQAGSKGGAPKRVPLVVLASIAAGMVMLGLLARRMK